MTRVLSICSFLFLLFGCSSSEEETIINDIQSSSGNAIKNVNTTNSEYYYKATNDGKILEVFTSQTGNEIQNNFVFSDSISKQVYLDVSYSFDPSVDGWKFGEQTKVINFAKEIQQAQLKTDQLNELNYILDNTYLYLFDDVDTQNLNQEIFSPIYCLKSAVMANLRAIEENSSIITGTISPAFLAGKTMFMFQEDIYIESTLLKDNVAELEKIDKYADGDDKLLKLIKTTTKEKIRYDEIYELYISKADFLAYVERNTIYHWRDCDYDNCDIGCGTDWGCCGSYMGCCQMSAYLCYLHDIACMACQHIWCFSGCKPDYGDNIKVKYFSVSKL